MPLPLIAAGIQALAGVAQAEAAGPVSSGVAGDNRTGGINVGSKVVGSGSASTSIPEITSSGQPMSVQPDGSITVGPGASLLAQPWLPLAVGGVLVLLIFIFNRRGK